MAALTSSSTIAPLRVRAAAPTGRKAVSVRASLPKVAESARLALAGAAAVLVLSTAAVQPAMANSCGSMPTACVKGVPIADLKKPTAAAAAEKKAAAEQAAR